MAKASLRDIRKRIASVRSTQQITKAMKMVASAKLRRAQENILATRPYATKMFDVLSSLAARTSPDVHPLLSRREPKKGRGRGLHFGPGVLRSFQHEPYPEGGEVQGRGEVRDGSDNPFLHRPQGPRLFPEEKSNHSPGIR